MSDLFSNKVCCCVYAVQDPHVWTILWIKIIGLMMNHLPLSVVCSIEFSYVSLMAIRSQNQYLETALHITVMICSVANDASDLQRGLQIS